MSTESAIIDQLRAEIDELKAQLKLQNDAHNEEISSLRTEINDLKTITSKNRDKIMPSKLHPSEGHSS